jgi:ubiquinone/menaquinone biosynthesis C-methylase UbiE
VGEIFERVKPAEDLDWTGERFTTATSGQIEIEHLHRYFLARELCRGLDVLDIASGEGYGSALLAQTAASVIGVEIDEKAVDHANASYDLTNVTFKLGDAREIPLEDNSVDAVVSFETLEHFFEHNKFLREVKRVLRPNGRLIISSPERDVYSPLESNANPFHVNELSRVELESLLHSYFQNMGLIFQRPIIGSALISDESNNPCRTITFEKRGQRHFEATSGLPRPPYLIAIASDGPLGEVPNSLFIETSEVGLTLGNAAMLTPMSQKSELATSSLNHERERANASEASLHRLRTEYEEQKSRLITEHEEQKGRLITEHEEQKCRLITEHEEQKSQLLAEREGQSIKIHNLEIEIENLKMSLDAVNREFASVSAQRQALRQALRRGSTLFMAGSQSNSRLLEKIAILENDVSHWQAQYFRLRGRLEKLLHASGAYRASRLLPRSMRMTIRRILTGNKGAR